MLCCWTLYQLWSCTHSALPPFSQVQHVPGPPQGRVCALHPGQVGGGAGHRPGEHPPWPQCHCTCQHCRHHGVRQVLHQWLQLGRHPGAGLCRDRQGEWKRPRSGQRVCTLLVTQRGLGKEKGRELAEEGSTRLKVVWSSSG